MGLLNHEIWITSQDGIDPHSHFYFPGEERTTNKNGAGIDHEHIIDESGNILTENNHIHVLEEKTSLGIFFSKILSFYLNRYS